MKCALPAQDIEKTLEFHGHVCPGVWIGIRAAELALREIGHARDTDMVAVVETDMCGVDAIQCLTGCTLGKGNLVHRDYGKMAFSFFDRDRGTAIRAVLNPASRAGGTEEMGSLMRKVSDNVATQEEKERLARVRKELERRFQELDLEEMFVISKPANLAPRPARILESLVCAGCGETMMESRARRFDGNFYCLPCFLSFEQKI